MNNRDARNMLMPGLADIEGKIGGVEIDLCVDLPTGNLNILGRRIGSNDTKSSVLFTKDELSQPKALHASGLRALAFARKLVE